MAEYIDKKELISKLELIRDEHASRSCSAASLRQATAIGYAIEVIKRIPVVKDGKADQS